MPQNQLNSLDKNHIWAAGGVIINKSSNQVNKVLICFRKKENLWSLPKGKPENRETVNVRVDKTKRSESSADLSRLNCRPNSPILLLKLKVSTNRFCVVYNSIFFHSLF